MKLLIKIFSQTTCIILLVSTGIFLYTTYCWKNQSIQNINSYESSIFRTNILQFENKTSLSDNQKQNADNEMRPQIVTYAFRQVFHDSAVLYLDGKMTYNGTVYEGISDRTYRKYHKYFRWKLRDFMGFCLHGIWNPFCKLLFRNYPS